MALDAAWLFLKSEAKEGLGAIRLVHRDDVDKIMAEGMHPQEQVPGHIEEEDNHRRAVKRMMTEYGKKAVTKPFDISKPGTWYTLPHKPWLQTIRSIMNINEYPTAAIGVTGSMHDFEHQSRNPNQSSLRMPEMYVTDHIPADRLVHLGSYQEAKDSLPEPSDVGVDVPRGDRARTFWGLAVKEAGGLENSPFVGEGFDWPEAPEEQ